MCFDLAGQEFTVSTASNFGYLTAVVLVHEPATLILRSTADPGTLAPAVKGLGPQRSESLCKLVHFPAGHEREVIGGVADRYRIPVPDRRVRVASEYVAEPSQRVGDTW